MRVCVYVYVCLFVYGLLPDSNKNWLIIIDFTQSIRITLEYKPKRLVHRHLTRGGGEAVTQNGTEFADNSYKGDMPINTTTSRLFLGYYTTDVRRMSTAIRAAVVAS